MSTISFLTPLSFDYPSRSYLECFTQMIDRCFYFGGRKAEVLKSNASLLRTAYLNEETPSLQETAIKVSCYCAFVLASLFIHSYWIVIPATLLITKIILRTLYQDITIAQNDPSYPISHQTLIPQTVKSNYAIHLRLKTIHEDSLQKLIKKLPSLITNSCKSPISITTTRVSQKFHHDFFIPYSTAIKLQTKRPQLVLENSTTYISSSIDDFLKENLNEDDSFDILPDVAFSTPYISSFPGALFTTPYTFLAYSREGTRGDLPQLTPFTLDPKYYFFTLLNGLNAENLSLDKELHYTPQYMHPNISYLDAEPCFEFLNLTGTGLSKNADSANSFSPPRAQVSLFDVSLTTSNKTTIDHFYEEIDRSFKEKGVSISVFNRLSRLVSLSFIGYPGNAYWQSSWSGTDQFGNTQICQSKKPFLSMNWIEQEGSCYLQILGSYEAQFCLMTDNELVKTGSIETVHKALISLSTLQSLNYLSPDRAIQDLHECYVSHEFSPFNPCLRFDEITPQISDHHSDTSDDSQSFITKIKNNKEKLVERFKATFSKNKKVKPSLSP